METGTAATKPRIIQMPNGSENASCTRISEARVLSPMPGATRPASRNMKNSGMVSASTGIICAIRNITMTVVRKRNRNRVTATAARNTTRPDRTTTDSAMTVLFRK